MKQRISLRQYKSSDLDRHAELLAQNKVYRSKSAAKKKESPWLSKAILNYKSSNPKFYVLAILLDKKVIGNIIAEKIDFKGKKAELGFWIGRYYWGKGYATNALNLFITFLRKKFGIKTFKAEYKSNNPASGRVLEKAGFKKIKPIK